MQNRHHGALFKPSAHSGTLPLCLRSVLSHFRTPDRPCYTPRSLVKTSRNRTSAHGSDANTDVLGNPKPGNRPINTP